MFTIATLLCIPSFGRIRPGSMVSDVSALEGGDRIFLQGRWSQGYGQFYETPRWISAYYPAADNDSVLILINDSIGTRGAFELEDAGTTYDYTAPDGSTSQLKGFYLKNLQNNKYLVTVGQPSGTDYVTRVRFSSSNKSVWYFAKAIYYPDEELMSDSADANAYWILSLASDGTKLYMNNNYSSDSKYYCAVATPTDGCSWFEIDEAQPDDNSLGGVLADLDELYTLATSVQLVKGTNPGFCLPEYVDALDAAIGNSSDDSQFTTAEEAQACYDALLAAYLDVFDKGIVPMTDGYYYVINSDPLWDALNGGTVVALSAKNGNEVWWNTIDSLNNTTCGSSRKSPATITTCRTTAQASLWITEDRTWAFTP